MFIAYFSWDLFLIGRHKQYSITQPTNEDREWQTFATNLQLTPIPNNTTFSRQGVRNCTHTIFIDNFYTLNNH